MAQCERGVHSRVQRVWSTPNAATQHPLWFTLPSKPRSSQAVQLDGCLLAQAEAATLNHVNKRSSALAR
ncbi:MAG: hypothetical protein RL701_399 [Pseudomonadota bacterium]|jgi:hypothetical protein